MRLSLLLLVLLAAPLASAQDDYTVFVLSQGAFGAQNSSVVEIDGQGAESTAAPLVTGRIYTQGAEVIGDRLYLTAGDSFSGTSRVDVVDIATGEFVGQITQNVQNPRYLAEVASGKAYVTNQDYSGGASFVTPIDLTSNTAGTPIEVQGTPEGLTVGYDAEGRARAFVALGAFGGKDSLAVLDPSTDALLGYVDIECAARFVIGTSTNVWAVCPDTDEAVGVDPTTLSVVERVAFDVEIGDPNGIGQDAAPIQTTFAARTRAPGPITDSVLISTATGLVILDGASGTITATIPIADTDARPITALGGLPWSLYLGRPDPDQPFGSNGTITVHDAEGALLNTFDAGVFPSYVAVNPSFGTAAEPVAVAAGLGLALAGPNPVRQRTALALTLGRAGDVRVEVVDVLGRAVAMLAEGARAAGVHRLDLDASGLPAGTYLVRAAADGGTAVLPLTLVR